MSQNSLEESITISQIKSKINNALNCFYSENHEMFENWKTKKSYVYAFSKILEKEFDSWDVDCYYVHYGRSTHANFSYDDRFCKAKDDSVICEECLNQKWCKACPDIVIHHRNTQEQLLIIQTVLSCRNQSKIVQDLEKIENFIDGYNDCYIYGLFINWAPFQKQLSLKWLSKSIIVKKKTLDHKKIKESDKYVIDSYQPYKIPKITTSCYIVGLLDILGAKKELNNARSALMFINSLNRNYHLLDSIKTSGKSNMILNDKVIIRIYSDNIIFAQKSINKAPLFDFFMIRLYMAEYQLLLLSNGLLSRGFITQGNLYINDSFIIGSALVKVHEAEKDIAKYPRVVIDPQLMRYLPDQIHQYPFPPDPFLKKDRIDGNHFLNYYQALILENEKIWHRALFDVSYVISEKFKLSNQETFPKLYWLVKYHNSFCKKYQCDEFKISQDLIENKKKEIKRLMKYNNIRH